MTLTIQFAANSAQWEEYEPLLRDALDYRGLDYTLATDVPPEQVDYIVYSPDSKVKDFTPFTRLKAVLNLWAGIEKVVGNQTLTVPLCRMVDDAGLTQGMVEWVTGHVLRHHLGMDAHIMNPDHKWTPKPPPLARERKVAMLGLGELGQACAAHLVALGFDVHGWSRTEKSVNGVTCHHGNDGLTDALTDTQIIVLLLPDTPATTNVINSNTLNMTAKGAFLINPGRGPLIDDDALIAALDSGQIAHATLDVFRIEPLPQDHPFWAHPQVTITPHIASATRPKTAAQVVAMNIHRNETGAGLLHVVDRTAGY